MSSRSVRESFCAAYEMIPITTETACLYGELYRHLAAEGQLIGTNDMWIAATALTHGLPVLTGNERELRRAPNLTVVCVV